MEAMDTDNGYQQDGDAAESNPPKRRTRFEDAPEEAKNNLPPPGRFNPGHNPMLRPPGLMTAPPNRGPRPLMSSNMDEEPPSFFNPRGPGPGYPPRGPRPRAGLGYQGMRPGMHRMGFPPHGGMPPGFRPPQGNPQDKLKIWLDLAGVDDEVWVETRAGEKSYYYHAITRQTVWLKPEGEKVRIVDQAGLQVIVEQGMKAEREKDPQAGMQPLMGGGQFPGFPPGAMPGRMPMPTDPDLAWAQFISPDGRPYYYNSLTQENTWEKPKAMIERERNNGMPQPMQHPGPMAAGGYPPMGNAAPVRMAQPAPVAVQAAQPQASQDTGRPVCSLPVSGTPWCVVWTGDSKVFFFNPTTKMSLWQRPPDLYNRPDVDLMVSKAPDANSNGNGVAASNGAGGATSATVTPSYSEKISKVSDDDMDEDNSQSEPPRKKTRQEKKQEKIEEQKRAAESEKKERAKPKPKEVDPDILAERQAQEKRLHIPVEERKKEFREMLIERGVSANSSFQKELSKIVFDARYLLLSAGERRDCFDEYARERAEIERAERKAKAKEAKENFLAFLKECDLNSKSSYSSFSNKYGKEERYKAVEKNRDREDYFKDYVDELYKKEREERKKQKEAAKEGFLELLKTQEGLHRRSKWSKVKKNIYDDPRYTTKPLDSEWREELFKDYVSSLAEKEESDEDKAKEKPKEEKAPKTAEEIAIENRKREVESEMSEHKRERNKEKGAMMVNEEADSYKLLLKELIKHGDDSWHGARKILKKDNRYKRLEYLSREEKEAIYKEHVRELTKKREEILFSLFNDEPDWDTATRWKDVRDQVLKSDRYLKYSRNEKKLESDFREWKKVRLNEMLDEFKSLLKETKIITHESKTKILLNEGHLSDILSILEKDKRYLDLASCPEVRETELENYIEDLDKKGPPHSSVHATDPDSKA